MTPESHALYVENGVIKAVHISEGEDDPAGDADPSHTLAEAMMTAILLESDNISL